MVPQKKTAHIVQNSFFLICLFIYSTILLVFVCSNHLSTFGNDSINYLVMGLYMSPWQEVNKAIIEMWPYQEYPPLYPAILAITGIVHDLQFAHAITAIFFVVSLVLFYFYLRQQKLECWPAFFIVSIFALSPGAWMNNMGILSETLYLLISFLFLLTLDQLKLPSKKYLIYLGILLGCLILTRTIGIAMLLAFSLIGLVFFLKKQQNLKTIATPIVIAIVISLLSKLFLKTTVPDDYIDQFSKLPGYDFTTQYQAIIDGWFTSWQYYWLEDAHVAFYIACALGILTIAGLLRRLFELKPDAVYIIIYLTVIMIWPHPGQTFRFLFPVMPLLLFFAYDFISYLANNYANKRRELVLILSVLIVINMIFPTLVFTYYRYQSGVDTGLNKYKEYYLLPDLAEARQKVMQQQMMFEDFKRIKLTTNQDSVIAYFEPEYVTYLAERRSEFIRFYETEAGEVKLHKPDKSDYVLLTSLHPRKTREQINGLYTYQYFKEFTDIEWISKSDNETKVSYFLKVLN